MADSSVGKTFAIVVSLMTLVSLLLWTSPAFLILKPYAGEITRIANSKISFQAATEAMGLNKSSSIWTPTSNGNYHKPSSAIAPERCVHLRDTMCQDWFSQIPITWNPPPRGNKSCLWDCNHHVGVCDAISGWCRCPAGWTGDACDQPMKRPCSQRLRPHGFLPYDGPINWNEGGMTLRCGGLCDDDIGFCYCKSSSKYGRVPPDPHSPPGTPPTQWGRPLGMYCQPNFNPETLSPSPFGDTSHEKLYGPDGWCESPSPNHSCPCLLDGLHGPTCEERIENFCPNQCSGHGECYLGWCHCHEGFFGHDCAYRRPGVDWETGRFGTPENRPWLEDHAKTPAAEDPAPSATRLRPLIYVYELPPMYNQLMLMYRFNRHTCTHRLFDTGNVTKLLDHWGYTTETGLHEMILQSKHRTLDPEEADFFYVPIFSSCMYWPVLGAADFPYFHGGPNGNRVSHGTNMWLEAWSWLRSHHPWWDRFGGRDHILLATHDEGSCYVPAVMRNATVLTHWGRKDANHTSGTAYDADNYSVDLHHPVYQPEGHLHKIGNFPCYDAQKDLVVPAMASAQKYSFSPLFGAPEANKTILAFFKGELRRSDTRKKYSRNIRQTLNSLCMEENWWDKHRIWINDTMPPSYEQEKYSAELAKSKFCFVLPGDGWSARFEDAILNGCIPLIIQDEVDLPFESIFEYEKFTLRISEKDIPNVPAILAELPEERIQSMLTEGRKVWHRFYYGSYVPYKKKANEVFASWKGSVETSQNQTWHMFQDDDAFQTILLFLYKKMLAWDHEKLPRKSQG